MKKIFTRSLCICMVIALVINIAAVAFVQMLVSQQNNMASSEEKLNYVKEVLAKNNENILQLTETLGENNLSKTRAFADLLAVDASILEDAEKMNNIKERLMVNELHVIDEKGIITHSTIDAYIGFDMNSGEQSAAFMPIVKDPTLEIVQEPEVNVAEGIVMQYIGVARKDDLGLVQVGIRPEVLENMLAGTQVDVVLNGIEFGESGYIYAVDAVTGNILAHPDAALIGTSAQKAGILQEEGEGSVSLDGIKGKYVSRKYNDMYIGTFMPIKEYYQNQISQTLVMALSIFIIFTVLLYFINRLLDKKIVFGIQNITESVKKISEGDFTIIVKEQSTPEFSMLSSSVNKMVESICQNIKENEELIVRQKEDMSNNLKLIENIKLVCSNLEGVSQETLSTADAIHNGTNEQEQAVKDLEQVMGDLSRELSASAKVSNNAAAAAMAAAQKIEITGAQMQTLESAIENISNMSVEIGKIIGEINSIAQQTNMLSLNASIEAARVGEAGKGFAVVAAQVGELAARSAQAARQTSELITNSIHAVEQGMLITEKTAKEFASVVTEIEEASHSVKEITSMVKQNVDTVSHAVEKLDVISDVVEKNVEISNNSKAVSERMADESGKLLELVE
ncbi:MAG: methyl-accepting chemotaxis protein [Lachnospiraceae bacterium]|nr:methyl-accepting chemotaxis protein [Lachnospiraceae bacterium]MCI8827049.1 methyl-accepting chemotaxis protein [Lachnospiraceae bacterium]MCI9370500.1 methyl-accepting chemotaxis protein [Lachnospiraceae bacterium]